MSNYPEKTADRSRWIEDLRPSRNLLNVDEPYAYFLEKECSATGEVQPVATIFLTNRECPFRCVMCDLWRNTTSHTVPSGAIPKQIDFALERLPQSPVIKLYNSGSFFDPLAIPPKDYQSICERLNGFERVIVECHPAFVGEPCAAFGASLAGRLEVAMGLETAHPVVLQKLNKQMTLSQFAHAADVLRGSDMDLRVFILVQPPFLPSEEALEWAMRSLDFAFDCGAHAATLIPTRGGNGAMEQLGAAGEFTPPRIELLESAAEYGIVLRRGRVFTDLWDVRRNSECECCFDRRRERLHAMNLSQRITKPIVCTQCQ